MALSSLAVIPQLWLPHSAGYEDALNLLRALTFSPGEKRKCLHFLQWLSTPRHFYGKTLVHEHSDSWKKCVMLWSVYFIYFKYLCWHVQAAVTKSSKNLKSTEVFRMSLFKGCSRYPSPWLYGFPQLVGDCIQDCTVSSLFPRRSVRHPDDTVRPQMSPAAWPVWSLAG